MVHPLGIIRSIINPAVTTLGYLRSGYRLYSTSSRKLNFKLRADVHKLVAEVFLNNNKPLDKNVFIDHIDTNRQNNRVENLKICSTRSENMNNPLTKEKISKKVMAEGVLYKSISECAKHYGLTRQAITFRINSKYKKDFYFVTK